MIFIYINQFQFITEMIFYFFAVTFIPNLTVDALSCCNDSFVRFWHNSSWYLITSLRQGACVVLCSVLLDPLWPRGLEPARPLCSWNFPGKNTGLGSIACSRASSRLNPCLRSSQGLNLCLLHWQADSLPLSHPGNPPGWLYISQASDLNQSFLWRALVLFCGRW